MREQISRPGIVCMALLLLLISGLLQRSWAAGGSQSNLSAQPHNGSAVRGDSSGSFVVKPGDTIYVQGWEELQNGCFYNSGSWTVTHLPTHGTAGQVIVQIGQDACGGPNAYATLTYVWTDTGALVVPCQTQDTLSAYWQSDDGMFNYPGSWTFTYFPRSLSEYYQLCGPGGTGRSSIWWYKSVGSNVINGVWNFLSGQAPRNAPSSLSNLQPTFTEIGTLPNNWSLVGQRDFNGDGNTDDLWRDTSAGTVALWLMNGTQVASATVIGSVPTNWVVAGVDDFNNDGLADILWRDNNTGNLALWLMNGTKIGSVVSLGNVPMTWTVSAVADFNDDGKADILWRDGSGNVDLWLMNGGQITSNIPLGNVPNTWSVAGVGDFNGDSKVDILWRDTSGGNVAIWFMNGAQVSSTALLGSVPLTWAIVATGDYNGDSKSDILWRDTSGNVAIWEMNGGSVAAVESIGNVDPSWAISSVNAE